MFSLTFYRRFLFVYVTSVFVSANDHSYQYFVNLYLAIKL